jgi:FkbM family methyltransferase
MRLDRILFSLLATGVKMARATRLTKLARWALGPVMGRIVHSLSPGAAFPSEVNGQKMFLAAKGHYPPIDMALDRYEPETTQLFKRLLSPGMVVVDVGGHVGYFSLLAARLVGATGKVFTFEPDPTNYDLLVKNIALNGHKNILPTNRAVSNTVGSRELYLIGLDNGRHSTHRHPNLPEQGAVTVTATTLDAFLQEQGWPKVDLVKVDVEGAEFEVLSGMRRVLERSETIKLILEFKPTLLQDAGVEPEKFLHLLETLGFEVRSIDVGGGAPSPLIRANFRPLIETLLASDTSINLYCAKG